jgi:hypothetical protein
MEGQKIDIKALFGASLYQSPHQIIDIKPWIFFVLYQSASASVSLLPDL